MKTEGGKRKDEISDVAARVEFAVAAELPKFAAAPEEAVEKVCFGIAGVWRGLREIHFRAAEVGWFFDPRWYVGGAYSDEASVAGDPLLWYCRCLLGPREVATAFVAAGWPEVIEVTHGESPLGKIVRVTPEATSVGDAVRMVAETVWSGSEIVYEVFQSGTPFGQFAIRYPLSKDNACFQLRRPLGQPLPIVGSSFAREDEQDRVLPTVDPSLTSEQRRMYFMLQVICRLRLTALDFE